MLLNPKLLSSVLFIFGGTLLALITVTTFPFILIYRIIIWICATFLRPDLEMMASGVDIIAARDIGFWDTKQELATVFTLTLKSSIPYELVYNFFQAIMADPKHQRLRQYLVPWMGFGFWKRERGFSLSSHIFQPNENGDQIQNDKWLNDLTKELLKRPFGKRQSPWDVHIISNYQPQPGSDIKSAFLFRFHHSLTDGHSLLKLFATAFDNYIPIKYETSNELTGTSRIHSLALKLLFPYYFIKLFFEHSDWNNRQWTKFSGEIFASQTKIPIDKILLIRRKYRVSFNAIVFSAIATTIRNILLRKNSKIPQTCTIGFPFPKEAHPDDMCNHFIGLPFSLPVGISDSVERLLAINCEWERLTSSRIPAVCDFVAEIGGRLPYWFTKRLWFPETAFVTIFPFAGQKEFLGCAIGDYQASMHVPLMSYNAGMAIMAGTINGYLYFRGTFDKVVLASDKRASEAMEDIRAYYDSLLFN